MALVAHMHERRHSPNAPLGTPDSRASYYTACSAITGMGTGSTLSSAPDIEAVTNMLTELGIEPWEEDEFGWIAEVGLKTPPPPRWVSKYDAENGATYFYNLDSETSTWDNPLAPHLARVVEIGRMYLKAPQEGLIEEQKRLLWASHKEQLDCWHGPIQDGQGNSYFVNSKEGVSSWQDPRISAQYCFDVQSGLIRHLQGILGDEDKDACGGFSGGTPWETEDGAQVLLLEGSPVSRHNPGRKLTRITRAMNQGIAEEDRHLALRKMSTRAEWVNDARASEEEVQRLRLLRKVEERRVRKLSRKLTKAIQETVQEGPPGVEDNDVGRRIAWGGQGKLGDERDLT